MRGFSLPVVLFVVSLGGALAAGGAFVARQMAIGGRTVSRSISVEGLAEEWLVRAVTDPEIDLQGIPVASTTELPTAQTPIARVRRWVTRSDSSVFWVVVELETTSKPLLQRRLGVIAILADSALALVPGRAWSDLP